MPPADIDPFPRHDRRPPPGVARSEPPWPAGLDDDEPWMALADALATELPEFVPRYRALVEACDDDPGEPAVLMELADFVAGRLATLDTGRPVLERAFGLVEALLASADEPDELAEVVSLAFFDSFSPEVRQELAPWLGARSLAALESLDAW
jgi:hypothetical protein